MKFNADKIRQAKRSNIQIGDMVLLRQKKTSKLMTKFDPHPFKVIRIKGTMITATRNEKFITRNDSLFKPVTIQNEQEGSEQDVDEDFIDDNDIQNSL